MKITQLQDARLLDAIHAAARARDAERPGGLHLSAIVNDILRTLYPKEFDRPQDGTDATQEATTKRMYFELGNTIEDVLADALMRRMPGWVKPAPRTHQGIMCSPDGYSERTDTIDEMKATWKSAREFERTPKFTGYKLQALAYAHVFGARRVRLHVWFLNGDWRPPVPWPPQTWILRPTSEELRQNWDLIRGHAKDRGWL